MKYNVDYERKTTNQYWTYASETIEARGLMHAQKLANDHLKALQKNDKLPMRISRIKQMEE